MNVFPVSITKVGLYNSLKQKQNTNYSTQETNLPSHVDAKSFVNVNFKANTEYFDSIIRRVKQDLNTRTLAEIPYVRESGIADKLKDLVIKPLKFFHEVPNGLIFSGEPGTGKTSVAKALAIETKLPLYRLKMTDVVEYNPKNLKYESIENIEKIFEQLRQKYKKTGEPSFIHIENADSLFSELENEYVLLEALDLLHDSKKMGIIPIIEPVVKLPSYVTKLLPRYNNFNFTSPTLEVRKAMIRESLAPRKRARLLLSNNEAINEIAEKTDGMSPRKWSALIDNAAMNAIHDGRRDITKGDILKLIYFYK